ncbi:MFS transporter [Streptomyces fradiae]|uniref:MFS transporter n=3 Tax=Streptomyces TaxID=1883 RepID=A0A1Y2NSZ0_STRFR|nr:MULTISPECIES: MFS transporter [Streptomyces]KAF0649911.1 MFS transporter [Streptomyces fradiae ATCC 10745 = DSM 40063]OSY50177.1 putative nitrate/nitrite transporter NarK2 [Streptomyces fradiae ATCC 10745 = DSM 40063]QEV14808.1 NarK/NasA family nitrate transporter [Streptomyces fradiae ATCC 10745 = DSM 40063]
MDQPVKSGSGGPPGARVPGRAWLMLALATVGFAVNFWAWALLSPLAPRFKDDLGLSSFEQSLLVAVPVVVGSLGRIPVGALTDRYGGRLMFPLVSGATVVPVLYLGLAGHASFAALLVGGFFLGIGGTAFAVGVPFVNAWFPPERRGLAIGVFGAGMGGTAISALTTVRLVDATTMPAPFLITAGVLVAYAVVAALLLRDAPGRTVPAEPLVRRLAATVRLPVTWQASALYAVAFGGYVAFSVYLPTYLRTGYGLTQADAANRMAGFVLLAVAMRPVGGWLSDRLGPVRVLAGSLAVVVAGAVVQAFTPPLAPLGTVAFLSMAAALGAGSGATFALVALLTPAGRVGSVTGVVGAAGGLGGFLPPLVMGTLYGRYETYAAGLALLAVVAAAALVYTLTGVRAAVEGAGRPPAGPQRDHRAAGTTA